LDPEHLDLIEIQRRDNRLRVELLFWRIRVAKILDDEIVAKVV
jgi:hypothetical protein